MKINELMPFIYAARHDEILENYLENNEFKILKDEKNVYGRSKTGYIFNVFLSAK